MKVKVKYLIKLYEFISPYYTAEYLKKCIININNYEIINGEIEIETDNKAVVLKIVSEYYYCINYLEFNQLKELYKTSIHSINDIIIKNIIE